MARGQWGEGKELSLVKRRTPCPLLHRFLAFAVRAPALALAVLAAVAIATPVLAAPDTPEVRQGHGAFRTGLFTRPGAGYVTPEVEYGLTDRLAVRVLGSEGSYTNSFSETLSERRAGLTLKYEVDPRLAVEAFTEQGWQEGLPAGSWNGFGLYAGQQFGPLYASLKAQAVAQPFGSTYRWLDLLTAAGSFALTPQLNLLGAVNATLDFGTEWQGSYGLEWQASQALAVYLNRYTGSDSTEIGAEYRF